MIAHIDLETIDPDLIARFRKVADRFWADEYREMPLGLAVSGGPDSLAMLLLAHAALSTGIGDAFPGDLRVISIDHGLRPEAAGEVELVRSVCAALDIPFTAKTVKLASGNLQARAREARYGAIRQWAKAEGIGIVATAHHADDQAETLLMRLARGSGLSGLAGVREWTTLEDSDVMILRPLLTFRKAELEEVVAAGGIAPARDPSNQNAAFDRVRVREHLADHDWLDALNLATSAQHLSEGWRALEWYAQIDWEEMVMREDAPAENGAGAPQYRYFCNVPRAIQVETVTRIVAELGGRVTRSEAGVAADRLWRGENASLGGVLARPSVEKVAKVGVEMRVWRFTPEPPRRLH